MNMSVENGDVNSDYGYINSSTRSVRKYHDSIDYTNKRDEIFTNRYLREKNVLQVCVYIDYMLPASALNQYVNTENNNGYHNLKKNCDILT